MAAGMVVGLQITAYPQNIFLQYLGQNFNLGHGCCCTSQVILLNPKRVRNITPVSMRINHVCRVTATSKLDGNMPPASMRVM